MVFVRETSPNAKVQLYGPARGVRNGMASVAARLRRDIDDLVDDVLTPSSSIAPQLMPTFSSMR